MSKRKVKLGVQQLRAGFVPTTFNEDRNTIDIVWTTGSRVKRFPFFGEPFMEELSLKKSAVNLERLNNGAPLLDNHNARGLKDIIGVVETAKMTSENGERVGVATVRLSEREDLAGVVGDIKNGIIRNISVGYRINKFEELKEKDGELPVLRAVDWTPMELSFVGIPADAGAQSRSMEPANECEIINSQGENAMGRKSKNQVRDGVPVATDEEAANGVPVATDEEAVKTSPENSKGPSDEPEKPSESKPEDEDSGSKPSDESPESDESSDAPKEDEEDGKEDEPSDGKEDAPASEESEDARSIEKTRGIEIRSAVKIANLDEKLANDLIEKDVSIEEARKLIFQQMGERTSTKSVNTRTEVNDMDQRQVRREAAVRGIVHAARGTGELQAGDNKFRHQSILQTARNFLLAEGVDASAMSDLQVAERALHTTSDFNAVLSDSCNKMLIEGFEEVPSTFQEFTSSKVATNFKAITGYRLSTGGILEQVNEHGEYPRGSVEEKSETYKVKKHGEIIGNTFEMLVNDDLGAFVDIPRQLGQKARRTENETFWAMINSNKVMSDGFKLFSAQHGNLGTPGTISISSLGELRKLLRRQLDESKKRLNLTMQYLVVPTTLETIADQFISQVTPNTASQVNPFSGLQKLVEPILDDGSEISWFGFGSMVQGPMAEISRLGGDLPEITTRQGFDVDGMEMKIRHIFGMNITDHRLFTKNAGVQP